MNLFGEEEFVCMESNIPGKQNKGKKFERLIAKYLKKRYPGHDVKREYHIGNRPEPDNSKIRVDILFNHDTIVSAKYQGVAGTAEEKIIQEMGTLQYLCDTGKCKKAYVVYGGKKFTKIGYYRCDAMKKYFRDPYPDVKLISFAEFKELNIV